MESAQKLRRGGIQTIGPSGVGRLQIQSDGSGEVDDPIANKGKNGSQQKPYMPN